MPALLLLNAILIIPWYIAILCRGGLKISPAPLRQLSAVDRLDSIAYVGQPYGSLDKSSQWGIPIHI
jgi:hypothetical protein